MIYLLSFVTESCWIDLKKPVVDLLPLVTKIRIDQMIYDQVELKLKHSWITTKPPTNTTLQSSIAD